MTTWEDSNGDNARAATQSPDACAFLFDNSVERTPEPQLAYFTGQVLDALRDADPEGRTLCQIRVGLPMLSAAAERTTGLRSHGRGGGQTRSHDVDTYKYLVWDWIDSLTTGWSSLDPDRGADIFRRHTGECVTLTALDDTARAALDQRLRSVPGYIGAFALDAGNLVHRAAFQQQLIYGAAIIDGAVVQELSFEGDPDWPLEGADRFRPNGLVWCPFGWLLDHGPAVPVARLSERGALAAHRLARKHQGRVEHRLIEAIARMPELVRGGHEFTFDIVGAPGDILQGLMPEGKFTQYLFNPSSKDGAPKGAYLVQEIGLDPEDWRFLAAQLYEALLTVAPQDMEFRTWKGGYGVRFNLDLTVHGRTGRSAAVRAGWMLEPGALPKLSTVLPASKSVDHPRMATPPVLPPRPHDDEDWSLLFDWADGAGQAAAAAAVPTPMFLAGGEIVEEGGFGSASVRVPYARRGFARWLIRNRRGDRHHQTGAILFSPTPLYALDRSRAWAVEFSRVLKMNGLEATVECHWD